MQFQRLTILTFVTQISCIFTFPVPFEKQYGVIMDAGSSSTKLRVYSWEARPGSIPVLEEIFYSKVKPGISNFENNVAVIPEYIKALMDKIKDALPAEVWTVTPVYFMATAGLRFLDENVTRSIISSVETALESKWINPYHYTDGSAHLLSGEEEALYAWITINYLNGFFFEENPMSESFGLVELGGGSAQIAFSPEDPIYAGKTTVQLAGREYAIYGHSHLSYGATMKAERIREYLIKQNPHANVIVNPCMLTGDRANSTFNGKHIGMVGGGNASLCQGLMKHFLGTAADDMCSPKPCSIGQVYQPPVRAANFYTFGLIYMLATDLGVLTAPGVLDLELMQNKAVAYCGKSYDEVVGELGMHPQWASRNCEDGLYVPLLFSALGFAPDQKNIVAGKDINDSPIAWSIGAILYEEERNRYELFSDQYDIEAAIDDIANV